MSIDARKAYSLSHDEVVNQIAANGHKRTVMVEGHIGSGKSSILYSLGRLPEFANHKLYYFDCSSKDLGDLMLPRISSLDAGSPFAEFVPHWELGLHEDGPIILMFDEFGKANPSVKLACLKLMLERSMGNRKLHPESIVFGATNLSNENVGDMIPSHGLNRMAFVTMRKPTNLEWIEWGYSNGVHPAVLGWARETPQLFQEFQDVKDPKSNPYIFHPSEMRKGFVTPRSLHAASDWIHVQDKMSRKELVSALMGTIGDRGALDLEAFITLANDMPKLEDIKTKPTKAPVPTSPAAMCMVVYRSLSSVDPTWIAAWMTYMERMPLEAQALFANGVRSSNYPGDRREMVMRNRGFVDWAMKNNHMFIPTK